MHAGRAGTVRLDACDARRHHEPHALGLVAGLVEGADRRARRAGHGAVREFDDADVRAARAGGGGDLQADVARADDDQPRAGGKHAAQRRCVRRRPQAEDPVRVDAGQGKPPRAAAGREDRMRVGERLAVLQADGALLKIKRGGARAEAQGHAALGQGGGAVERLGRAVRRQPALGEGRALVGLDGLVRQEDDLALVAARAQVHGGGGAAVPGADDDGALRGHASASHGRGRAIKPRPRGGAGPAAGASPARPRSTAPCSSSRARPRP